MKDGQKFFLCKHCGNFVGMIVSSGAPMVCCGENMTELVANTEEASYDKHIPVIEQNGDKVTVTVGSTLHPMIPEHHLTFVFLETKNGGQRKRFAIGQEPKLEFTLVNDEPIAAYAYCNLHGLWKTTV